MNNTTTPLVLNDLWQAAASQQYPTHSLYVVGTPIGNLCDITVRALYVLQCVDAIACEDTRHSKKLLQYYGIDKPLIAAHEHNEQAVAAPLIARLRAGERVAYITDAGTPAISDPGARLVAQVREADLRVIPISGANAAITALCATGVDGAFAFVGFLPPKTGARQQMLEAWRNSPCHLVLYEAPHRLAETVRALAAAFPQRRMTVARELSKLYEQIHTCALSDAEHFLAEHEPRGEYVLVLHHAPEHDAQPLWHNTLHTLLPHLPLKQAVALTVELTRAAKNEVYEYALHTKQNG